MAVANVKDLRLPAISVARLTLYLSSLRLAGPSCVVNVSAQVVPHSRELKFSSEVGSDLRQAFLSVLSLILFAVIEDRQEYVSCAWQS